ncbi:MAG: hypothetical protein AAGH19_06565 [Pseudomonadota bacterium]
MSNRLQNPAVCITLMLASSMPLTSTAFSPCADAYAQAVTEFRAANYALAEHYLTEAIAMDDQADSAGETPYLPYAFLAAARYERGDLAGSKSALQEAERQGIAQTTESGRALLSAYGPRITTASSPTEALSSPIVLGYGEHIALSELESELLRSRVLKRCALSETLSDNLLPWYFHYLLGLEYRDAGDQERALEAFQLSASLEASSGRKKRLYGMWFVDYLPYFEIAAANANLGRWDEAERALKTSRKEGELKPGTAEWEQFLEIRSAIEANRRGA